MSTIIEGPFVDIGDNYRAPFEILMQPIKQIAEQAGKELDNMVCHAVLKAGVIVDKDELIKALMYDRGQYTKGYHDGYSFAKVRGHWIGEADGYADGELVYDIWSCSCCGKYFDEWDDKPTWNFCPNCGAYMGEEAE